MRFTIPLLMVVIFMIGAVTPTRFDLHLSKTDDEDSKKKYYPIETGNMDGTKDEGTDYFGCLSCWDLTKPFKPSTPRKNFGWTDVIRFKDQSNRCECWMGCKSACIFTGLGANN